MGLGNKIAGVLMFLIAGGILTKIYFWIPILASVIEEPFFKAMYWISFLMIALSIVIIKPLSLILSDGTINVGGMIGGLFMFMLMWVVCIVIYYIMDGLTDFFGAYADILWFGYFVIIVLGMVVIPNYFIIGDEIKEKLW